MLPTLPTRTTTERPEPAMKFVLASYGGRGDVEPAVVVGRELQRRGHDVHMAVPPNLVGFVEAAGLAAVAYGLDSQPILDAQREYWTCYFRTPWKLKELNRMARETEEFATQCWGKMTTCTGVGGGRCRPATHRPDFRATRCQRRGVLRHSVGHAAFLPGARPRPTPAVRAAAFEPHRNDAERLAGLARDEEGRGRAAP